MFPIYLQVLRIILIVVAAFNVVGLIVAIVNNVGYATGLIGAITNVVGGLISSLFTAFGVVTLSFAGIERAVPGDWKMTADKNWSPDDLLEEEDREHVKILDLTLEITFTLIFITLINFFLDRVGIYYLSDGTWVSAPILNEHFLRYVPWITAYNVIDIIIALYLLRLGFWDKLAAIVKVLNNAFKVAVTIAIITGPAILTIDAVAWNALGFHFANSAAGLTQTLNTILDVLLGLSIFGMVVDAIRRLYLNFLKGNRGSLEIKSEQ